MAKPAFFIEERPVANGSWLAGRTVRELRDRGVFTLAVFLGEERHEADGVRAGLTWSI